MSRDLEAAQALETVLAGAGGGRVVARFGPRYRVRRASAGGGAQEFDAIARGRRLEVVVGDVVACRSEHGVEVIESIAPRRTLLFRSDAVRTKPLAANVDQLAIVIAAQPSPQPEFVWRALVAARAAGIEPLFVQNKGDLEGSEALHILTGAEDLTPRTLRVSAKGDPATARASLGAACAGRSTLFVGQSGMGKSTLLGLLLDTALRTGALSRRGTHGRQTTSSTHWYPFGAHGAVVDSPGFQEFGLSHLSAAQIAQEMPDVMPFAAQCRFADCRHLEEPGCAVRAAVAAGAIRAARYAFYRRLLATETSGNRGRG